MSGMNLAGFEANSGFEDGDRIKAEDVIGRPLLIFIVDRKEGIRGKFSSDPKPGLILDIFDMSDQKVYLSVLWMNQQVVDNLSRYIDQAVAIQLVYKTSQSTGRNYINLEPLEGEAATIAGQWVAAQPNMFVDARASRGLMTYQELRGSTVTAVQPIQNNNAPAAPAPAAPAPAAPAPAAPAPAAPAPAAPAPAAPAPAAPAPAAPAPAAPAPAASDDGELPF